MILGLLVLVVYGWVFGLPFDSAIPWYHAVTAFFLASLVYSWVQSLGTKIPETVITPADPISKEAQEYLTKRAKEIESETVKNLDPESPEYLNRYMPKSY